MEDTAVTAHRWGMLCHLSALSGFIIPLGHLLGPLLVWALKREDDAFVESQGKESLNFQISVTIYGIVAGLLIFAFVGMILLPALLVADLALTIIAALKAGKGENYH